MINKISWYPWLSYPYKIIIDYFGKHCGYRSVILYENLEIGIGSLIYAISRRLMCIDPIGIKSCGFCYSCKLMLSNNHPDFYKITKVCNEYIKIENIKYAIELLSNCSFFGNIKLIWISSVDCMTEEASNYLLNILENTNINIYFLLECHNIEKIKDTLKSRCLCYNIAQPNKKNIILWLRSLKLPVSMFNIQTSVLVSMGSPIKAFELLQTENWAKRKMFYKIFESCVFSDSILELLNKIDQLDFDDKIAWIVCLLLDILKYKSFIYFYYNIDQISLIKKLSRIISNTNLLVCIQEWQMCRYNLINIVGLDKRLQILSQLIRFKNYLNVLKY